MFVYDFNFAAGHAQRYPTTILKCFHGPVRAQQQRRGMPGDEIMQLTDAGVQMCQDRGDKTAVRTVGRGSRRRRGTPSH
jgi:hypothetical protein